MIVYQRHWQRRDTAANLASINEVLYSGELCVETDTGKIKCGDGLTPYNDLLYVGVLMDLSAIADGYVLQWHAASGNFIAAASVATAAPYIPTTMAADLTVPAGTQLLFSAPIDVGTFDLDIAGYLIEVS